MKAPPDPDFDSLEIARRWCRRKGADWSVREQAGRGGTAPVYSIASPNEPLALKIYDEAFSTGEKGAIEEKRIARQVQIGQHDCPSLVRVFDGGSFEGRLYVLMNRAPGGELEKRLGEVPRNKIRHIVDQVARAAIFLRGHRLCHRDIKSANVFISDDFQHATLLDLSVTRDIFDPIGLGTDHDGQLPIVATARYSPPEYLFRLLEPGPNLWHALDVYQLGALLHDLIMREPLFQTEYVKSKQNRYRFAWIVATALPEVHAEDVDQDLVFLARRALDKDWQRRSKIRLEDFLADGAARRSHSLQLLGLGIDDSAGRDAANTAARYQRLTDVARGVEEGMRDRLHRDGVTAVHLLEPGEDDAARRVKFQWSAATGAIRGRGQQNELCLYIRIKGTPHGFLFEAKALMSAVVGGGLRSAEVPMPDVEDGSAAVSILAENASAALDQLAMDLAQARER